VHPTAILSVLKGMTMGGYVLKKREALPPQAKSLQKQTDRKTSSLLVSDDTALKYQSSQSASYYENNLRMQESTYSWRDGGEADATQPAEILNTAREAAIDRRYDTGHEFWSEKKWVDLSHKRVSLLGPNGMIVSGPLYPANTGGYWNIPNMIPSIDANYYGNKAISATAPTASNANFAVTAAELIRERITLPGMAGMASWLKSRSSLGKSLGSEWLNVQFGLVPVMSDAQKLFASMMDMNKTIMQLIRDDGRPVRRRYSFPVQRSTTSLTGSNYGVHMIQQGSDIDGGAWAGLYQNPSVRTCNYTVNDTLSQRYWFSGAFTYKIPADDSLLGHFKRYEFFLNKLTGIRITPEVLWELTPWSWLTDWFVDVQSFTRATSLLQNDGLVLKYGYLMRTSVFTRTTTLEGLHFANPQGYVNGTPIVSRQFHKRIERVRSTPFGFGLNPNSFTDRQWAILAALGLSRGR
jgi:hypothetical protein